MTKTPLVSAIMPTRGRQGWARQAVEMFHAQTWPNRELIIIDDLSDRSFPLPLTEPNVSYHLAPRFAIGAKRNMAVSRSSGPIIMHWDSDDIYTPDRMEHQARILLAKNADLVGYCSMEFVDEELSARYRYSASPGYAIGVSMCYWRETWETRQFDAIDKGEDNSFLAGRRVFACDAEGRIIARVHGGNTAEKRTHIAQNPAQWRRIG